jgi:hypothetical protein
MSPDRPPPLHRAGCAFLARLGVLRILLLLATLALLFSAPVPGTRPIFHGWGMIPTLIMPTLAPLVFMVLLLDAMMSAVFMADTHGAERARRRRVAILQLSLAAALAVAWYPYFRAVMSP